VRLNPDGSLAQLKTHLVAKNYSVYGMDYQDDFSIVAKLICADSYLFGCHLPLAPTSVKCQEYFS